MIKKAVIISSKLVQDQEFVFPYYRLLEEEFEIDVCLPEGEIVKGFQGINIPPNKNQNIITPNSLDTNNYNLCVLPGGVKSMEQIRLIKNIIDFIHEFNNQKKVIACICSAAQLLISAKIVKNRNVSGYYSMKDDLINAGAIYVDEPAVVDDNLITTAHYKDLGPWFKEALNIFYKFNS
jgi:protease I